MKTKIFGCKTNKYFSEKWESHPSLQWAKGVFVASCVVTDQAKAKWVKFVKRSITGLGEGEKIFLTGCGSIRGGKIDEAFYEQYSELAAYKDQIVLLGEDPEDADARKNLPTTKADMQSKIAAFKKRATSEKLYTRKHLVIQTGCDNFCTFCLTLQARGRHKTQDAESILTEIREYEAEGGKEVVLTGTNLGAWGAASSNDFRASKLIELIDLILTQTTIPRLRISSLGVEFVSDELLERFRLKRLHAYVHLSVQSGSDTILGAMNRHYNRDWLLDRLAKLVELEREDGIQIQIGADLIVGFPGETESDFADTLSLVEKFGITQLHAFPFSAHVDKYHVPAGNFPNQIPERTKLDRLDVLMKAWEIAKEAFLRASDGKRFEVLLEWNPKLEDFRGWSENYIDADAGNFTPDAGSKFARGEIVRGIYHFRLQQKSDNTIAKKTLEDTIDG